jgi:hypothetical protein
MGHKATSAIVHSGSLSSRLCFDPAASVLVRSFAAFHIGVEISQVAIVALLFPLLLLQIG